MSSQYAHVLNTQVISEDLGEYYAELALSYLKDELLRVYKTQTSEFNPCAVEEWVLNNPDLGQRVYEDLDFYGDERDEITVNEFVQCVTLTMEGGLEEITITPEYKKMQEYLINHKDNITNITFNDNCNTFIMVTTEQ